MTAYYAYRFAEAILTGDTPPELMRNTSVSVYVTGGSTLASLFADENLTVPLPNPVQTDGFGNLVFWTATPVVDLTAGSLTLSGVALVPVPSQTPPGIYIPAGWGANWRAKRNAAGSGTATVALVGDSVGRGCYASNLDMTSWAGLLRTALQGAYGDGGSGWKGACDSSVFLTALSFNSAAISAWATAGNLYTLTGTGWSSWTGSPCGPGGGGSFNGGFALLAPYSAAATATVTVRGTTVRIYTLASSGNDSWSYTVDGGAPVAVANGASTLTVQVTTVTGLIPGNHAVVITPTVATAPFYLIGVAGENAAGVIWNNYSAPGSYAHVWDNNDSLASASWAGGSNYPADLVIWQEGINDAHPGTDPASWAQATRQYLSVVRENNPAADVLFIFPSIGNFDNASPKWQQYAVYVRGLAEAYGAALVDMWTLWRNAYAYGTGLGYWGNGANPGPAGTDPVHLSDAGHQAMANAILPILTM